MAESRGSSPRSCSSARSSRSPPLQLRRIDPGEDGDGGPCQSNSFASLMGSSDYVPGYHCSSRALSPITGEPWMQQNGTSSPWSSHEGGNPSLARASPPPRFKLTTVGSDIGDDALHAFHSGLRLSGRSRVDDIHASARMAEYIDMSFVADEEALARHMGDTSKPATDMLQAVSRSLAGRQGVMERWGERRALKEVEGDQ